MLLISKNQIYIYLFGRRISFCKSSGEEVQVLIFIDTQKEVVTDFMNLWKMIGFKYVSSTALAYRFKAPAEMLSLKLSILPIVKTQRNSAVLKYMQLYMSYKLPVHKYSCILCTSLLFTIPFLFFHYSFPSLRDLTLNKLSCCLYS